MESEAENKSTEGGKGIRREATCETKSQILRDHERQEAGAWDWNEGLKKVGEGHVGRNDGDEERGGLLWMGRGRKDFRC